MVNVEAVLDQVTRVAGVRAAVVCDYEGIHIASQSAVGAAAEESVAAMAAEIGKSAAKLLRTADGDELKMAMFGAANGNLVMADAGKGLLAALTDQAANTGLLRMEVEKAAERLASELEGASLEGERAGDSPGGADQTPSATAETNSPA
jgi:predicted regulator of Ras-like GTPase activity (Roadblock/LC7/MglB family)